MTSIEVVREAKQSTLRRAREIAAAVVAYPLTVWRHRDVVSNFYVRELRARFRGTVLGFAWPFALPLALFLVYYFVFANLLGARLGSFKADPAMSAEESLRLSRQYFTVYLFVGVIVWAGFAESVLRNASVILENSNLIKKVSFPSELLPLNVVLASLTIQALALGAYCVVAPLLGWNVFSWRLVALPALFAVQALFALGISLGVAAANVFVRDTVQVLGILMTLWQFMTPVFWSPDILTGDAAKYGWVLHWNPMNYLLDGYRKVLVNPGLPQYRALDAGAGFAVTEWPWEQCAIVAGAGLAVFVVGYSIFLASKRKFADEL